MFSKPGKNKWAALALAGSSLFVGWGGCAVGALRDGVFAGFTDAVATIVSGLLLGPPGI